MKKKGTDTNEKTQTIIPMAQTVRPCPAPAAQTISSPLASRMHVYVDHALPAILVGFPDSFMILCAVFGRIKLRDDKYKKRCGRWHPEVLVPFILSDP